MDRSFSSKQEGIFKQLQLSKSDSMSICSQTPIFWRLIYWMLYKNGKEKKCNWHSIYTEETSTCLIEERIIYIVHVL